MDQEQDVIEIEEVIEGSAEEERVSDDLSSQMEDQSIEDELMPRPAFQIEEDHQNLTQQEKEAFSYILAVRNQKQDLISNRKKNRLRIPPQELEEQPPTIQKSNPERQYRSQLIYNQLKEWRAEALSNWKCVTSNMHYLHKTKNNEQLFKQKLTMQSLFKIPEVTHLCCNKWLTLPQIESFLIFLSNIKYQALAMQIESGQNLPEGDHFHIWIYSLLALHQSYASYTNFQALGSVNACLQKQFDCFEQQFSQEGFVDEEKIIKWTTSVTILIEGFNQMFLKQKLSALDFLKQK